MATTEPVTHVRLTSSGHEVDVDRMPELGETRTYTVTATCRGHRAREVDGAPVTVADMGATSITELAVPTGHTCEFDWCETVNAGDAEHWYSGIATSASMSGNYAADDVATGVSIHPGEPPAVWIHLSGNDHDVDTYMTYAEATRFHEALMVALIRAREAA